MAYGSAPENTVGAGVGSILLSCVGLVAVAAAVVLALWLLLVLDANSFWSLGTGEWTVIQELSSGTLAAGDEAASISEAQATDCCCCMKAGGGVDTSASVLPPSVLTGLDGCWLLLLLLWSMSLSIEGNGRSCVCCRCVWLMASSEGVNRAPSGSKSSSGSAKASVSWNRKSSSSRSSSGRVIADQWCCYTVILLVSYDGGRSGNGHFVSSFSVKQALLCTFLF